MIDNNFLLIGYLIAVLNMVFIMLVFFMVLEVIRELKLFKMPVDMFVAACGAFIFVEIAPLLLAVEQAIKNPQYIGEVLFQSTINMLPAQISVIILSMCIWIIIKGFSSDK